MTPYVVRVRIDLKGADPQVRRRVDMPVSASLDSLHHVIQAVMDWEYAHMHEFVIAKQRFCDPEFLEYDYTSNVLSTYESDLADIIKRGIKKLTYTYDFGDNWQHEINLGRVRDSKEGEEFPTLVSASGRCPPEDCGGVYGYWRLLDVLSDPSHEDYEEMNEWYGDLDPEDPDEPGIRDRLQRFAIVPKKPATRKQKSRRRRRR